MGLDGPGEPVAGVNRATPDSRFLGFLRTVSLVATVAGATGSLGLMLRAGRNTPRLLLVAFVFWILAPFAALTWANLVSRRWAVPTRAALYCVTPAIALGSLALYGGLVVPPAGTSHAFAFVIGPAVSLLAAVVPVTAIVSRRMARRSPGV
jgi:hypothetical protein